MNIASALLKRVLELQDFETWSLLRRTYLPAEYHSLYWVINNHCDKFHSMPTIEDLKLQIRDANTRDKLYAISTLEVDAEPAQLLEYLKNEYTQKEILDGLSDYIEKSVAFEDAEASIASLHQVVIDVESKVDLEPPQETMQRIPLFETDEEYGKYLTLGINAEFDLLHQFSPRDYILVGGFRGSGKSLTCSNIQVNMYDRGRSSIYYSTEMDKRPVLRRNCSIATGIPEGRIKFKNLSTDEWARVASWWSGRFTGSEQIYEDYLKHRDFDKFHNVLTTECVLLPEKQMDIVYDPNLTIAKIDADINKKIKSGMDIGIIIVDYINKVHLNSTPSNRGRFDWVEQIEVSAALKEIAATYEIPLFSPFQINQDGSARFSKGIDIDADAAYILNPHNKEDNAITFTCTKMRDGAMKDFTSSMDWNTLKMGPDSVQNPDEVTEDSESKTGEAINDIE